MDIGKKNCGTMNSYLITFILCHMLHTPFFTINMSMHFCPSFKTGPNVSLCRPGFRLTAMPVVSAEQILGLTESEM